MKSKYLQLLMIIFFYFLPQTLVFACDMKRLQFGASIEQIADKYELDTLGASPLKTSKIVERGTQSCSNLPSDSIAIFTFLYGKFVQLKLEHRDGKDTLLLFIKEYFDVPEQTEDSPKNAIAFDPENPVQSIVYKVQTYEEGKEQETVTIIAKNYDELFRKAARDEKNTIAKD